jgi:hypothetical protein
VEVYGEIHEPNESEALMRLMSMGELAGGNEALYPSCSTRVEATVREEVLRSYPGKSFRSPSEGRKTVVVENERTR